MSDFTVDEGTRLGRFLRRQKIQMWRIPVLVRNGGVQVFRNRAQVTVKDETDKLMTGDVVRLVSPLPARCQTALQREATANWRDYAIVPGSTPFDVAMAKVIDARPRTIRLKSAIHASLRGFIQGIATSDEITHPIRHLIVVSHATIEGRLKIAIDAMLLEEVNYEDLEDAIKKKLLLVDTALLMPRPAGKGGAPIPAQFFFLGCRIGHQAPFMKKLKEALGNQLPVVAPNHLQVGAELRSPPGGVEYMSYAFQVNSPTQLKDKAAVVTAFAGQPDNKRENGTPVTAKEWNAWVPRDPNKTPNPLMPRKFDNQVRIPVFNVIDKVPRLFVYRTRELFQGVTHIPLAKDTGKEADRKKAVKTWLENSNRYTARHPFPEYVRYGYRTMDEFMDGWSWDFKYDAKAKRLSFRPTRHQYHLGQPITRVANNALVLNFYPTTRKGKPIDLLKVTDTFFYSTF